jgi:peptidyl-prolyl cis-trans isomerase B (cyclophilin B)
LACSTLRDQDAYIDSRAVSKAAKRERQRLNREARREAELVAAKRRQRFRLARNVGVLMLPLAVLFVVLQVVGDEEDKTAGAVTCAEVKKPEVRTPPFTAAPPLGIDPTHLYTATIDTSCGEIELLLDAAQAPTTVNNFVFLAREGFYDDLAFVRSVTDFVVQAGSPTQTNEGGPGYTVPGEVPSEVIGYQVGKVAMAKTETEPPGTAGSQFFIITSPGQGLDTLNTPPYQYALLGQLADDDGRSLRVARQIESLAPEGGDGPPTKTVVIEKVTIDEKTPESATTTTAPPAT